MGGGREGEAPARRARVWYDASMGKDSRFVPNCVQCGKPRKGTGRPFSRTGRCFTCAQQLMIEVCERNHAQTQTWRGRVLEKHAARSHHRAS